MGPLEASDAERRQIARPPRRGRPAPGRGRLLVLSAVARQPSGVAGPAGRGGRSDAGRDQAPAFAPGRYDPPDRAGTGLAARRRTCRVGHGHVASRGWCTGHWTGSTMCRPAALPQRPGRVAQRPAPRRRGYGQGHLSVDGTRVRLAVTDDGCGFEPAILGSRAAAGHLGLRGLDALVGDAGGRSRSCRVPDRARPSSSRYRSHDPVVIVDDHAMVRCGLEHLLSTADEVMVVAPPPTASEAVAPVDEVRPTSS